MHEASLNSAKRIRRTSEGLAGTPDSTKMCCGYGYGCGYYGGCCGGYYGCGRGCGYYGCGYWW